MSTGKICKFQLYENLIDAKCLIKGPKARYRVTKKFLIQIKEESAIFLSLVKDSVSAHLLQWD